jgi:hypothetical protein
VKIAKIIKDRGIEEILHFTTNRGLTGTLDTKVLLPRKKLPEKSRLEHIVMYNCPDRSRDSAWHNYVNLSISNVNSNLFDISKGKWHKELWWCILSFSPIILTHPGVYFTTTNNMYSGVMRAQGFEGLEKLFANKVERWTGNVAKRVDIMPLNQPTCNQAEVLYPEGVSIEFLNTIYVQNEDNASKVDSIIEIFPRKPKINCIVRSELFERC